MYGSASQAPIPRYEIDESCVQTEYDRLHTAIEQSRQELANLQQRVLAELGQAESDIFRTHVAMLADQHFASKVKQRISRDLINVEHALDEEVEDVARLLSEVENEYLRERSNDIYDIRRRVLKHLGHGSEQVLRSLPPGTVLVARELLPSDTLNLDRSHVIAIVTERGGETSHAAILARSLGIPGVAGVVDACSEIPRGADVLIDGESGTVTLTPEHSQVSAFSSERRRYNADIAEADSQRRLPCCTSDDVTIGLHANIGRADEVSLVRGNALDGVGLFRTEYLFLDADDPPSLDIQSEAYMAVADALAGLPLTVRTLDLGGDKNPRFLLRRLEANPNLGLRGLRLSLAEAELLRTQLRAIVGARRHHENVSILFPMVVGADDLRKAIGHLDDVRKLENAPEHLKIGAMIETPSALFQLPEILDQVDFVSLGTNDLVQFMLAADRNAVAMMGAASVLHPSVLRAIRHVVDAAREAKKPVCVCGEAAGDPRIACLLVGLGVRQLSMSPVRAARARQVIRQQAAHELENLAQRAVNGGSEREALSLLDDHFGLLPT